MTPRALYLIGLPALSCFAATPSAGSFQNTVRPFLAKNCVFCHNATAKTADLNLDAYRNAAAALKDREVWEHVLKKLRAGEMPPKGRTPPSPQSVQAVTRWIEAQLTRLDRATPPDPGRVTSRRLNRYEYNNTIRDLLAIDFKPANDFPADDSGYGFDNIGDVLSLSPVLMEKYLAAAEKIARLAIVADPPPKPTRERYRSEPPWAPDGAFQTSHRFPAEANYEIRAGVGGKREPLTLALWLDGRQLQVFEVSLEDDTPRVSDVRVHVPAGEHRIRASLAQDPSRPAPEETTDANPKKYETPPHIDYLEVHGPFHPQPLPITESHKRIFVCGHSNGQHQPECARRILTALARRAYRRPVAEKEVDALTHFVELAQKEGDSFEQGVRLAVQAILVSPHFLFRIERDPAPGSREAVRRLNDYELASRLSYFLWSSMPDETLLRCAARQGLRQSAMLAAQAAATWSSSPRHSAHRPPPPVPRGNPHG